MDESRDLGRLWRRAIGMAAFGVFLAGLLVAVDLEELVVIALAVGTLCALAGVLTLLLARYRRALLRGGVGAYRTAAPAVVSAVRWTAATSRTFVHRAAPMLRRADHELGTRVRTLAAGAWRLAARTIAALVADIHAHREARASQSQPRARGGPIPARSPAARRADARRSAAERRRDRA